MRDPVMPATEPPSTPAADHSLAAVSGWHATLQERHHRGDRAALRRAQTIDDVYGVVAFHQLLRRLDPTTAPDMAARLAIALATVDQNWTSKEGSQTGAGWGNAFGRAAARFKNGKPRLSEDRLRLLLSAEDPDQFLRLLRGALHLLDGKAPLVDLARVVRAWHQPDSRPMVRRQIFLSYFAMLLPSEKTNA